MTITQMFLVFLGVIFIIAFAQVMIEELNRKPHYDPALEGMDFGSTDFYLDSSGFHALPSFERDDMEAFLAPRFRPKQLDWEPGVVLTWPTMLDDVREEFMEFNKREFNFDTREETNETILLRMSDGTLVSARPVNDELFAEKMSEFQAMRELASGVKRIPPGVVIRASAHRLESEMSILYCSDDTSDDDMLENFEFLPEVGDKAWRDELTKELQDDPRPDLRFTFSGFMGTWMLEVAKRV